MTKLLEAIDWCWNLRVIKGYRTVVARTLIALIAGYQWASTAPALVNAGVNLPDLSTAISAPILVYLAAKVAQFAKEHQP